MFHLLRVTSYRPKFSRPHKIIAPDTGNKFKIQHLQNGEVTIRHFNDLKRVKLLNGRAVTIEDENINTENSPENSEDIEKELFSDDNESTGNTESNEYKRKLRSYRMELCTIEDKTEQVTRIRCINEQDLEKYFYEIY